MRKLASLAIVGFARKLAQAFGNIHDFSPISTLMPSWLLDALRLLVELLKAVAWPLVVVYFARKFQPQVGRMLDRLRKGAGVELDPPPVQQIVAETSPISELSGSTAAILADNPALSTMVNTVRSNERYRTLASGKDREELIIYDFARVLINYAFDTIEHSIWASQLAILEHLHSRPLGETLQELERLYYAPAAARFPEWFANYPFQRYLQFFLRPLILLRIEGDRAMLEADGVAYLRWRLEQRKPAKQIA